jgi:hypothetical protein
MNLLEILNMFFHVIIEVLLRFFFASNGYWRRNGKSEAVYKIFIGLERA